MKKVEVIWWDSCSAEGWEGLETAGQTKVAHCTTAGYLIKKDKKVIRIASSLDTDNSNALSTIAIPMSCVKKIRILK